MQSIPRLLRHTHRCVAAQFHRKGRLFQETLIQNCKFIQTAHKYVGIDELDGYALLELVSAIYVDAPDKSSGKRVQHIHIKYDGLGFIPLNELMKEETA